MNGLGLICTEGYCLTTLILLGCAGYVYRVNSRRTLDDPEKKDYLPLTLYLVIVWPFVAAVWVILSIIRVVLYGVFLILFTTALVAFRKPFLFVWLDKMATKIGNKLLQLNTLLIRWLFLPLKHQTVK